MKNASPPHNPKCVSPLNPPFKEVPQIGTIAQTQPAHKDSLLRTGSEALVKGAGKQAGEQAVKYEQANAQDQMGNAQQQVDDAKAQAQVCCYMMRILSYVSHFLLIGTLDQVLRLSGGIGRWFEPLGTDELVHVKSRYIPRLDTKCPPCISVSWNGLVLGVLDNGEAISPSIAYILIWDQMGFYESSVASDEIT